MELSVADKILIMYALDQLYFSIEDSKLKDPPDLATQEHIQRLIRGFEAQSKESQ